MTSRLALLLLFFTACLASARENQDKWLQVTSPHFIVISNGSEKQARRVAGQFERMRAMFHAAFPAMQVDSGSPILVLALKSEKDFQQMEPESYLGKGKLQLAGLFLGGENKNYVLLRLDAEGEHPYSVIYHEYTHFLVRTAKWIPLWMNEGLAQFYENTEIRDKEVLIGQPTPENIFLLRQNSLLPLPTLFAVDAKSPYYHEENKGSIFYAESWALTHFLELRDFRDHTQRLKDYAILVSQGADPVSAASQAFGDLKQLQSELARYVGQGIFNYVTLPTATQVDAEFQSRPIPAAQADAVRADFLAYNQRTADAQTLLQQVLKEDPQNVSAHETMGFLAFRQGNLEEARKWYAQAVALHSTDYLAHYYFAALSMNADSSAEEPQVESSLRTAIKLNPSYAPAYDRLAAYYDMHHRNLQEARILEIQAVQLDPGKLEYRLDAADVLLSMRQPIAAIAALQTAMKFAKSQQDIATVQRRLEQAQQYQAMWEAADERNKTPGSSARAAGLPATSSPPPGATSSFQPPVLARAAGPRTSVVGTIRNVQCSAPAVLEFNLDSAGHLLALRTENYYRVDFTALGFSPAGELKPCSDLEGAEAKIDYVPTAGASAARILAVEIHKRP